MKKIVFENMPETYEEGNLIFFKEPFKVNGVTWGMSHEGCKSLILRESINSNDESLDVFIVAYPKSKEYNIDLFSVYNKDESRYSILNAFGGGSITELV